MRITLLAISGILLLPGCASIIGDSSQVVSFYTLTILGKSAQNLIHRHRTL